MFVHGPILFNNVNISLGKGLLLSKFKYALIFQFFSIFCIEKQLTGTAANGIRMEKTNDMIEDRKKLIKSMMPSFQYDVF